MTKKQGEADVSAALASLNEAQRAQTEFVDQSSLDSARRNQARAHEDHNAAASQAGNEVSAAQAALASAQAVEQARYEEWESAPDDAAALAYEAYLAAQAGTAAAREALAAAQKRADDTRTSSGRMLEDADAALANAEQNNWRNAQQAADARQVSIDRARDALALAQRKAENDLLNAARRIEDAESALAKAEQDYGRSAQQATDSRLSEIDRARDALAATQRKAETDLLNAVRRVEDADASLGNATRDHGRSIQASFDTAAQNRISAASLRLGINDQRAVVDDLRVLSENEGVLYSDIAGVVSASMSRGSITKGRDAIITFRDGAKGFDAQMLLDKADADMLAVGSECEVTTGSRAMFYTPTVTGIVSAITPSGDVDKTNVTIRLPQGEWTDGQIVDVQAIQNRSIYDMCLPLSALRSDNTGYFLLVIEQGTSVLGVENIALRLPVSVIASDWDMVSIEGPVGRSSQVITGSSRAVETGDRVRVY